MAESGGGGGPAFFSGLLTTVSRWQMAIRSRMASVAGEIKADPWGREFWVFMLLSFVYGMVHALGPGHGKLLAASYFMNRPGSLALGAMFGYLTMFFHVLSGAVLVLAGTFILRTGASLGPDELGRVLETTAYVLLALIGGLMLVKSVAQAVRGERGRPAEARPADRRALMVFALAAGLVPCPGSALVLAFAISLGIQTAGLLALGSISLGMGLTISLVSVAAIVSRGALLRRLEARRKGYALVHSGLAVLGSLAITLTGVVMLLGRG